MNDHKADFHKYVANLRRQGYGSAPPMERQSWGMAPYIPKEMFKKMANGVKAGDISLAISSRDMIKTISDYKVVCDK